MLVNMHSHKLPMNIKTKRLFLKEITWEDLEDIHAFHSIPEVDEYNTLGKPENLDVTIGVIRGAIEDQESEARKEIQWTISLLQKDVFVGLCGMKISQDRFRMGEIYYKLAPEFWGKGYATEVGKALIKFGFEEMNLHRIDAGAHIENVASIRVLEKIGMIREGQHRKILPIRGDWYDNYHYAIIETDPRPCNLNTPTPFYYLFSY